MSLDVTALQILKHRERHQRLSRLVPRAALQPASQTILADFGKYFAENPGADRVEYEPFMLWFRLAHPTLTEEKQALFAERLKPVLTRDSPEGLETGILSRLAEAELASRVLDHVTKFNNGEEVDFAAALRAEVERHADLAYTKAAVPWVDEDIADILKDDEDNRGLRWRLKCLNDHMRPLRGGDSIIWAGRPGKGKTSSLMGEVTYMVPQFDAYYGADDPRDLLWFNNEGPGRRIKRRAYQAALNATDAELVAMSAAGTLHPLYDAVMGGRDRLRVINIHGATSSDIESILKRSRPGLMVFDMVDNIKFGGALANKGERTDQVLEAMYGWARELGVKYDCPIIPTSQISAAGADMPFPSDHMLKDSKTGKQGACDGIVMIGTSADAAYPNSRFVSIVKTKMGVSGMPDSPNMEVHFDKERGRLVMPGDA